MAAKTTAVKTADGRAVYIGSGAVAQDGNLKLYKCNTCHREVVWATSTRTGSIYLVDVFEGQSGARFYVKASAHQCATAADLAARQALNNQLAEIAEMRTENNSDENLTDTQRDRLNASLDHAERLIRDQLAGLN